MKLSVYPLAWCYVAAFSLLLIGCAIHGIHDPDRISTTQVHLAVTS